MFNKATAIVGEGGHSEYVIPTDPAYRQRALALWQSAGAALMASGGILGQLIAGPESALLSGMSGIGGVMGTLGSGIAKQLIGDLGTWAGNLATLPRRPPWLVRPEWPRRLRGRYRAMSPPG